MLELSRKKAVAALAGAALCTVAPAAFAANCDDVALGLENPIYGAGGSAETQTIRAVAIYLRSLADHPITILWDDTLGACGGYNEYLQNVFTVAQVTYWDTDGTAQKCTPTGGIDFAHMGNEHDFCVAGGLVPPSGYPEGFGTVTAPVQTLNIIVDKDSSQKSISAEALYYILGFGAGATDHEVAPWTNPSHVVTRNPTSFASQFLAASIFGDDKSGRAVYDDPGKNGSLATASSSTGYNGRLGFRGGTQNDVITQIDTFGNTNAESPIGYVSGSAVIGDEKASGGRKTKVLAYQHYDQTCGYWPDSTESSHDKANVRNGKYHFWTPGHFFAHVGSGSAPDLERLVNPDVATFFNAFVGSDNTDVLNLVIDNGDLPLCAMNVTREGLDGPISSVAPEDPCGCFFESRVAGTPQCDSCREGHDDDCSEAGAVCRRGYCEAY
jgi:hypothetical protein